MANDAEAQVHAQWLSSGDPAQFERLIKYYQGPIFGFLARMGVAPGDAEDVAQDVFLRLWLAHDRYDPSRAKVSTWLWSIARNVSLNKLAQSTHRISRFNDKFDHEIGAFEIADSADPGNEIQIREQLQQVDLAIQQLSQADRLTIALVYVDELSNAEAAQLCRCTEGTFRVRLSRARQRLLEIVNNNQQVDTHAKATTY